MSFIGLIDRIYEVIIWINRRILKMFGTTLYCLIILAVITLPNFILYDFFTRKRRREDINLKKIIIRIDLILVLLYIFLFIIFQNELIVSEVMLDNYSSSSFLFEILFVALLFLIVDMFIIYINKYINYKISLSNRGIVGPNQVDEKNKKLLRMLIIEIIIAIVLFGALVFVFQSNELFGNRLSVVYDLSGISSNKLASNLETTETIDVNQFAVHGDAYSASGPVRNTLGMVISIIIMISYVLVFILYIKSIVDYVKKEIKVNTSNNEDIAKYRKVYKRKTKFLFIGITILFACALILQVVRSFAKSTKPIIYLYPEEEMSVRVELNKPEKITCSYPKYVDGWDVTAKPNGNLIDNNTNRNLYALYWEGINTFRDTFKDGFCVKGEDTIEFLEEYLAKLGLNEREAEEFIVYWLPILESNKYNIIRFETKEEIDNNMQLNITPKPDTIIRVMMDFKASNRYVEMIPQEIQTPERVGFTVVEWGGSRF